jgi:HSP20 family protein
MAIQRWDPVRDLLQLQERVNSLFENVKARSGTSHDAAAAAAATWKPPMDLFEQAGRWVIRVDLPGVDPKDVGIEIESDALVVRGERKADAAVPREDYLRVERPIGRFVLHVALPSSIDRSAMAATQRDGVLEIVLPKKRDEAPGRLKVEAP